MLFKDKIPHLSWLVKYLISKTFLF